MRGWSQRLAALERRVRSLEEERDRRRAALADEQARFDLSQIIIARICGDAGEQPPSEEIDASVMALFAPPSDDD